MKITDLEIEGFGVWSSLAIRELSPQLNVFYGPNEAGKTTLMQFTRAMCYGFSPGRRQRYLPPVHGGIAGGSMWVDTPDGRIQIVRHDAIGHPLGRVNISGARQASDGDSADQWHGQSVLRMLLGELDEPTFTNVFAIGLREIQELGTLSDGNAARLLYEISSGVDRVSLGEVMRELETSRERLLSHTDDKPSQIADLYATRAKLRSEIEELGAAGRRFSRLGGQRDQHHREIARLETEIAHLEGRLQTHDLALAVADKWTRRQELDRQLLGGGPLGEASPHLLARLDALVETSERHTRARLKAKRRALKIRKELAGHTLPEHFVRHAGRIQSIGDVETHLHAHESKIAQAQHEIADLERRLSHEKQQLGLPADASHEKLQKFATRGLAELKTAARGLIKARRGRLERVQLPAMAMQPAMQQYVPASVPVQPQAKVPAASPNKDRREVNALRGSGPRVDLAMAIEAKGLLVSQLRRRIQMEDRLTQLGRHQAELDGESRDHLQEQLLPPWGYYGLGGIFVVGVVMVLGGLFLPATVTGSMAWFLIVLGCCLGGAALLAKMFFEHEAQQKFDYCQKQLSVLKGQMRQAADERDALDKDLPKGGGPLDIRLQSAEAELAKLEERLSEHPEELHTMQREVEASQPSAAPLPMIMQPMAMPMVQPLMHGTRRRRSKSEMQRAKKNWQTALRDAGLSEDFSPKRVRQLAQQRDEALELARQIDRRREVLEQYRRDHAGVHGRITQLLADLELAPSGKHHSDHLRQLHQALAEHTGRVDRRGKLARMHRRHRRLYLKHAARLRKVLAARRRLLVQAGVETEDELRQQATHRQQLLRLTHQRDTLVAEIGALVSPSSHDAVVGLLSGNPGNKLMEQRYQIASDVDGHRRNLNVLLELRGELSQQIKGVSGDRRLGDRHLELAAVENRLRQAVHRWQVLATTSGLLDQIRDDYQRRHQPETLKEASSYLSRLTQGHYHRVWAPVDERVLRVDDAQGNTLPVEVLSRGTREQLFLSLRLALVSAFQRRGISLPLVLDDVLVNFDANRARAAAEVLSDYAAAGHQLLVFTCHEHVMEMFGTLDAQVRRLPENGRTGQIITVEERSAGVKKPQRGKKKPQPIVEELAAEPIAAHPPVQTPRRLLDEQPVPHVIPLPPGDHIPVRAPRRVKNEQALPQISPVWLYEGTPVRVPRRRRNERGLSLVRPVWHDDFTPVAVVRRSSLERPLPTIRPLWAENHPPVRVPRRLRAERALPRILPISGGRFTPVRSPRRAINERPVASISPVWQSYTPPVRVPKPSVVVVEKFMPAIVDSPVARFVPPVHVPRSRVLYTPAVEAPRVLADAATPVRAPKFLAAANRAPKVVEMQRINWSAEEFDGELSDRVVRNGAVEVLPAAVSYQEVSQTVASHSNGNRYSGHAANVDAVLKLDDADFDRG